MSVRHLIPVAVTLAWLAACGGDTPAPPPAKPAAVEKTEAKPKPAPKATPAPETKAEAPTMEVPEALLDPANASETAPDQYKVKFTTTEGDVIIEVHRDWAPLGADRFYNLVKLGFFNEIATFRVIENFMAQFGIHGDPRVSRAWKMARIADDPVTQSNTRGRITFATSGPNSRTTQLFINFKDNSNLDGMGFAPFGEVVEGMDVVDTWHKGYGEGAPRGRGPSQGLAQSDGNAYFKKDFPELDYILSAEVL